MSNYPAFPTPQKGTPDTNIGLTKKEFLAGLALQGLLAYNSYNVVADREGTAMRLAERAVLHANALIEVLRSEEGK